MSASQARTAVLKVYRALQKQAQQLWRNAVELELRKPLSETWGFYQYSETGLAYQGQVLAELVPKLKDFPGGETISGIELQRCIRANFKQHKGAPPAQVGELLNESFHCLRALLDQLYMQRCSARAVTDGVQVEVTSKFNTTGTSYSGKPNYVFTYRVRVTNLRPEPIQLLSREWLIKNDRGHITVRIPMQHGNAVVGQQPIIPPSQCWEYYSGTELDTPAGVQHGRLEVAVLGNISAASSVERRRPTATIIAEVPTFPHLMPGVQQQQPQPQPTQPLQ